MNQGSGSHLGIGFTAFVAAFILGYATLKNKSITDVIFLREGAGEPSKEAAVQAPGSVSEAEQGGKPVPTVKGTEQFDGHPVAKWIVPELKWARAHGWGGKVTSGYRDEAAEYQAAVHYGLSHYPNGDPSGSNHTKTVWPGGAVDVTEYEQLAAILARKPGGSRLKWGGHTIEDSVHFSGNGH